MSFYKIHFQTTRKKYDIVAYFNKAPLVFRRYLQWHCDDLCLPSKVLTTKICFLVSFIPIDVITRQLSCWLGHIRFITSKSMTLSFTDLVYIFENRQRIQKANRNSNFIKLNSNKKECISLKPVILNVQDLAILIEFQKLYVQVNVGWMHHMDQMHRP